MTNEAQTPVHMRRFVEALLYCDRQASLGHGLDPADVAEAAGLPLFAVTECIEYLRLQGRIKPNALDPADGFLLDDREWFESVYLPQLVRESMALEIHVGNKYEQNITNSSVGAASVGDHSRATSSAGSGWSQAEWQKAIGTAQQALVAEQDRIDDLAAGLYEALSQLLRMVRNIDIEQTSQAQLLDQVKDAVDEIWAKDAIKGLRPGGTVLRELETVKALAGPAAALASVLCGE